MAKAKTNYVCNECGNVTPKWAGQCEACGAWNTIEEQSADSHFTTEKSANSNAKPIELVSLDGATLTQPRFSTGLMELDRVTGGGIVKGSAILIGGDPGIGKSTMLLQTMANIAQSDRKAMYISGEESVDQIRLRAKRLGLEHAPVQLSSATSVHDILATLKQEKPDIVVIDSVQTMFVPSLESAPGTVSQVRMSAHELISTAKQHDIAILLVGHVTKEGQIAGPKVLEHMVDGTLYFEGDNGNHFRILRTVKNRFGPAGEIGVFEMTGDGLKEVTNPSALFISGTAGEVSGSVVFPCREGTRTMLVEIQALVSPTTMAQPRRAVVGWDNNRLAMILAVLQTRCGLRLGDKEVYLNIAGGIKVTEPAADLAVAAAIISALTDIPFKNSTVIFGEVGLSGEIRPVSHIDARLTEAEKLGFSAAIFPERNEVKKSRSHNPVTLTQLKHIQQLKNCMAED